MAKTRKSQKSRKSQKTRKNVSRKMKKKVELKNKNLQLYVGSKLQTSKLSWVSISDGYIYISRDNNRIYWVLRKLKKEKLPKISFNDKKKIIRVGNNKIVVTKQNDYDNAKALLQPYAK